MRNFVNKTCCLPWSPPHARRRCMYQETSQVAVEKVLN
jgi:hypothetical protein